MRTIAFFDSCTCWYCFPSAYTPWISSSQQSSIIPSSGERADHGKIDILFSLKYDSINLYVCTGALSCWKI